VADYKKTTKAQVLGVLMNHLHPSSPTRAKLSVHLKAHAKAGIKFDMESAQPLIEAFTKHTILVDQMALHGLMATQPDLDAVKAFAREAVKVTPGVSEEAKVELEATIEALKGKETAPANGANGDANANGEVAKLREGNVYIEDIHAFKAGLIPSKAPLPLEPLGPVAKL
jgi:insulysin